MPGETKNTEQVRKRYDRHAPAYDIMQGPAEVLAFKKLRPRLWEKVEGNKVLEVGVGTGKNFPYYPAGLDITAIDISERMLERAREKARKQGTRVNLEQGDVQDLRFDDNTFDTVAGSSIFCSVPDPIRGLTEVARVVKPGGKVVLLEHVLSANRFVAAFMNALNPVVVRMMGANINRRTVENVARSGLIVERVTDFGGGLLKLIEARKVDGAGA